MNLRRSAWLLALALPLAGCSDSSPPPATSGNATATAVVENEVDRPTDAPALTSVDVANAASDRPKIYDVDADGIAQIETALADAKAADKRVLLQFGANWCGWCHKLHRLFAEDEQIAAELAANYVVVLIDVDGTHNAEVDKKYGNPTQHGLPVIVVLDATGTQLTTQNTADLEEGDHHDPAKVMEFLTKWSRAGAAAESVTTDASPAGAGSKS